MSAESSIASAGPTAIASSSASPSTGPCNSSWSGGFPDGPRRWRAPTTPPRADRTAIQLMETWIPQWLQGETDHASAVDLLFVGLLASSLVVVVLLFFLLLRFAVHYRAGNAAA